MKRGVRGTIHRRDCFLSMIAQNMPGVCVGKVFITVQMFAFSVPIIVSACSLLNPTVWPSDPQATGKARAEWK
jgi:hypothetical protein